MTHYSWAVKGLLSPLFNENTKLYISQKLSTSRQIPNTKQILNPNFEILNKYEIQNTKTLLPLRDLIPIPKQGRGNLKSPHSIHLLRCKSTDAKYTLTASSSENGLTALSRFVGQEVNKWVFRTYDLRLLRDNRLIRSSL
jgi:hypothetical protein